MPKILLWLVAVMMVLVALIVSVYVFWLGVIFAVIAAGLILLARSHPEVPITGLEPDEFLTR